MNVTLLKDDDVTPFNNLTFTNYIQGGVTDTETIHILNNSGGTLFDLQIMVFCESLTTPDLFLFQGIKPQDELWIRVKIVGYDNTGDPTWSIQSGNDTPIGAWNVLEGINSLPDGCTIYLETYGKIPIDAEENITYNHKYVVVSQRYSVSIPGAGIRSGVEEYSTQAKVINGLELITNGTEFVTVKAGEIELRSSIEALRGVGWAFTDLDGASASLGAGESYIAAIVYDPFSKTIFIIKAVKYTTVPVLPVIGNYKLLYQLVISYTGFDPQIDSGDIQHAFTYGRFLFISNGDLSGEIHSGSCIYSNIQRLRDSTQTLNFTMDTTSWVWITNTGTYNITTTNVPDSLDDFPLWKLRTDGSQIILNTIEDLRDLTPKIIPEVTLVNPLNWLELD